MDTEIIQPNNPINRQRSAIAAQLADLSAENDVLAAEVASLRAELAVLKSTSGLNNNLATATSAVTGSSHGSTFAPLVLTEGDGVWPRFPKMSWQPHTGVITAVTVLSCGTNVIVVSSGGDGTLSASCVCQNESTESSPNRVQLRLAAPAVCVAGIRLVMPPTRSNALDSSSFDFLIVAGLMNGGMSFIRLLISGAEIAQENVLSMEFFGGMRMFSGTHAKYITRIAWSCSELYVRAERLPQSYLATTSADGSVALFCLSHAAVAALLNSTNTITIPSSSPSTTDSSVTALLVKIQQVHFGGGGVDACTWVPLLSRNSCDVSSSSPSTLIVAVRGSPTLYYLTPLRLPARTATQGNESIVPTERGSTVDTADARTDDQAETILHASFDESAWAEQFEPAEVLPTFVPDIKILLHRVPLSEDGGDVSILRRRRRRLRLAELPNPQLTGETTALNVELPQGLASQYFLPVGFSIVDLAVTHVPSTRVSYVNLDQNNSTNPSPAAEQLVGDPLYLLAAAANNGMVYVLEAGSNAVVSRLAGHRIGTASTLSLSPPSRIAWLPCGARAEAHYLAVTAAGAAAGSVVVYSAGGGKVVARLSGTNDVHHKSVVRCIAVVANDDSRDPGAVNTTRMFTGGSDGHIISWTSTPS